MNPLAPLLEACSAAMRIAEGETTVDQSSLGVRRVSGRSIVCSELRGVRASFHARTGAEVEWYWAERVLKPKDQRIATFAEAIASNRDLSYSIEDIGLYLLEDLFEQASALDDDIRTQQMRAIDQLPNGHGCGDISRSIHRIASLAKRLTDRPSSARYPAHELQRVSLPMIVHWTLVAGSLEYDPTSRVTRAMELALRNVADDEIRVRIGIASGGTRSRKRNKKKARARLRSDGEIVEEVAIHITELLDSDATASQYPDRRIDLAWTDFESAPR